jgi:hypothetical protein
VLRKRHRPTIELVMPSAGTNSKPSASRRRTILLSIALLLGFIALIVALLFPTFERQHQYATLRDHGVTTTAYIEYCSTGGINRPSSVTVTCPGRFTVRAVTHTEDILGLPRPLQAGDAVVILVDPNDPANVYPLADVRTGYHSGWLTNDTYVAVIVAALLALTLANLVIVVRRRRRT